MWISNQQISLRSDNPRDHIIIMRSQSTSFQDVFSMEISISIKFGSFYYIQWYSVSLVHLLCTCTLQPLALYLFLLLALDLALLIQFVPPKTWVLFTVWVKTRSGYSKSLVHLLLRTQVTIYLTKLSLNCSSLNCHLTNLYFQTRQIFLFNVKSLI